MVNRVHSNRISEYAHENGGRALILILLFLLALYQFYTAGIGGLAIICLSPFIILFVYIALKHGMFSFWLLFLINYLVQFLSRESFLPSSIPMSLYNEALELLLLAIAIIDTRKDFPFQRSQNVMLFALLIWSSYCTLQILNDTCDLGIDIGGWYTKARLLAFQLVLIHLIMSIYISSPEILLKYLKIWGVFTIFAAVWCWKQQHIGFTAQESAFLNGRGRATHYVSGIIRYFSIFSDAACFGCTMASSAAAFIVFSITSKIKKDRIFFLISGVCAIWAFFASGTRTALFCFIAGMSLYIVLSKSFKIAIPVSIIFGIFIFILAFTDIGQGNNQIRRMRSGFNKNDASANVRTLNQQAIKKYIKDAPWGIGLSVNYENVPANNKYKKLSTIPPDSTWVYFWVQTGIIGLSVFLTTTAIIFISACWIVFFKLKNKFVQGVGSGLCCAFLSIQVGGYANVILLQFPNSLLFYGGLSIVYILPYLEPQWVKFEESRYIEQEVKKRIKLEKKLAKRV